jgi:hypothetical protein
MEETNRRTEISPLEEMILSTTKDRSEGLYGNRGLYESQQKRNEITFHLLIS